MLQPTRIVAPTIDIVNINEAKKHLRVDSTDEDTLITSLITAVTSYLDGHSGILGTALAPQTWQQQYRCFENKMKLPVGPVTQVNSISYYDNSGALQTVSSNDWQLLSSACGSWLEPVYNKIWPINAPGKLITIQYVAGYSSIPAAIKQAALLLIGHWYENREAVGASLSELPLAFNALIAPYRRNII